MPIISDNSIIEKIDINLKVKSLISIPASINKVKIINSAEYFFNITETLKKLNKVKMKVMINKA